MYAKLGLIPILSHGCRCHLWHHCGCMSGGSGSCWYSTLIAHFITKGCIKQNPILSPDRSGNTAELDPVRPDNRPLNESLGLGDSIGEHVAVQQSPAYQAASMPDYM